MLDFADARRNMVNGQLRTFDVTDYAVLDAMEAVPREEFVPAAAKTVAYLDRALHLSEPKEGQEPREMLAPMMLGRLLQAARVTPDDRALDVGCGLGYTTAVLTRLCASVVALESIAPLAEEARQRLSAQGITQAEVLVGPLEKGVPAKAPFDVIVVNGAFEVAPQHLLSQLSEGGRLVGISAGRSSKAVLFIKGEGDVAERILFDAAATVLSGFRRQPGFVF